MGPGQCFVGPWECCVGPGECCVGPGECCVVPGERFIRPGGVLDSYYELKVLVFALMQGKGQEADTNMDTSGVRKVRLHACAVQSMSKAARQR